MNTEKKYGFSEIRDFILNKLPEDEKLILNKQITSDPYLTELFKELDQFREQLIEIDKLKMTDAQNDQIKKHVLNMISTPEPAPGQVWEFRTNYFALILSVADNEFINSMLVTHNHEVTGTNDLICREKDVSALPLAIHTNHLFTLVKENLKTYRGTLETGTLNVVQKIMDGEIPELPLNCTYGYGIEHEEIDNWNAFVEEILEEYHQAAFEEYEESSEELTPKIISDSEQPKHTAFIFRLPHLLDEQKAKGYDVLAASSDLISSDEDVTLCETDTTRIVYSVSEKPYSFDIKVFSNEYSGKIDFLELILENRILYREENISEENEAFKVSIRESSVVRSLLEADFIVSIDGKTFHCNKISDLL